jgi:probable HAF family extracellular repeat protein
MRGALTLVLLCCSPSAVVAQDYVPEFLDTFGSSGLTAAFATSRDGDLAAGLAVPLGAPWQQAALWAGNGTVVLPVLAGDESGGAYGVNRTGEVVGESVDITQQGQLTFFKSRGVRWKHGQPVLLSSLATRGDTDIVPYAGLAVNDHGLILGWGKREAVNGLRAFLLDVANGKVTDLGTLQGTLTSSAEPSDLNEQGVVVGVSEAANFFDHAFVWQDGVMTDLHVASGVPGRNSAARAINEAGTIVGTADPVNDFLDYNNAAVWEGGVLTLLPDLGDVGGVIESYARDINDHGTIVGTSVTPTFEVHAVTWRNGQCVDLNTLIPPGSGWTLANAHAISNDGRIYGEGFSPQGLQAFVLVPDSDGGFDVYGAGAAGSGGFVPGLWGQGWPDGGGELSLALTNGPGGAPALLLVGLGDQSVPFKGCTLSVLPLSALSVPLLLSGAGGEAGAGQWSLQATLPAVVPAGSLYLQAIVADAGGPAGFTVSNAVRIELAP